MLYQGVLTKMQTEFADPINYYLNLDNNLIQVHQLLQKKLTIEFA